MLKITKGLKKKKKGKKNKHKEEELFEAAELEQYRREHQSKEVEGEHLGEGSNEDNEEWKKFKLLTSGVDDILKKTQGDLDRIKSTSYFQRKPPGPSTSDKTEAKVVEPEKVQVPKDKKWIDFDRAEGEEKDPFDQEPGEGAAGTTTETVTQVELKKPEEEEEEESEEEEDEEGDDIFDTSYVDVVASGEVKLAYIPDSPVEEDTGFDPFDTSIVEKVIKVDPNEKKRNLVSLGSAVKVLTGEVEKPDIKSDPALKAKRQRRRVQDLLLGSFDESTLDDTAVAPVETPPKSILDEDPIFDEKTSAVIGLPPVTPVIEIKPICKQEKFEQKPSEKPDSLKLIDEFIPSFFEDKKETENRLNLEDDLDDEFTALAAESVSKEVEVVKPKPSRPAPPGPTSAVDSDIEEDEDDPFDTTFATKVLPGKFELKLIEKEILTEDIPIAKPISEVQAKINSVINKSNEPIKFKENFDEHNFLESDQTFLTLEHRDLLGGSTTDLSNIAHSPIKPEAPESTFVDNPYCDPFDTSSVDVLAAPGKTELKFLEKELLTQIQPTVKVEIDNDFDPRGEEETTGKPSRPDQLVLSEKKTPVPKVVAFVVKSPPAAPNLLDADQEESSKVSKPLTPYYPNNLEVQGNHQEVDSDPFDTSFVSSCPGKVELKLLESEFVPGKVELKHSLSDPDFDPRFNEAFKDDTSTLTVDKIRSNVVIDSDIISEDVETAVKLHTPVIPKKLDKEFDFEEDIDPFDTSIASDLLPGKTEIKLLEKELIYTPSPPTATTTVPKINIQSKGTENGFVNTEKTSKIDADILYHTPVDNLHQKPLTPLVATTSFDTDDIDPFDTSIVGDIIPGKTELKLLESELMSN